MHNQSLIPHLFRTEFRKIVAVISRLFGLQHIEIAEDIASETFLLAAETWEKKGIPENPTAWLYTVAKNKTKDYLKRNQLFSDKITQQLQLNHSITNQLELDISPAFIKDSELKMMFAVCHPAIPVEAQIGLALRILFGLGIEEIADAFLTQKDTINKRLHRAKEKLREANIQLEMPQILDIPKRISAVYLTLYLLFNQGYYAPTKSNVISKAICLQALQLAYLLTENSYTNTPELNALIALMCFHASRLDARIENSSIILLDLQDHSQWDTELILTGEMYLNQSASGAQLSKYHLEAAIAFWHTQPVDGIEKWENILKYYNLLLQVEYTPIAALNRTYAVYKTQGPLKAIKEALKLQLNNNHLYHSLLGQLYLETDISNAKKHLSIAFDLAKSETDKKLLKSKLDNLV